MKEIKIVNAKENNLKSVSLTIPREQLVVFTGLSGLVNPALLLIQYLPKVNADTSKVCPPMPANFWAKWTSPMWKVSTDFPLQFPSTKKQPPPTHVQPLVPLRKSTTTFVCCSRALAHHIVHIVVSKLPKQLWIKFVTAWQTTHKAQNCKFWRP